MPTTTTLHDNCQKCDDAAASARATAKVTGSVGATQTDEHRDSASGELIVDHSATWTRDEREPEPEQDANEGSEYAEAHPLLTDDWGHPTARGLADAITVAPVRALREAMTLLEPAELDYVLSLASAAKAAR